MSLSLKRTGVPVVAEVNLKIVSPMHRSLHASNHTCQGHIGTRTPFFWFLPREATGSGICDLDEALIHGTL